jgi:hypothetical protein
MEQARQDASVREPIRPLLDLARFLEKKRKKGPCIAHFRLFLRRRKGPKERQPAQPSPSLSIGRKFTTPATRDGNGYPKPEYPTGFTR